MARSDLRLIGRKTVVVNKVYYPSKSRIIQDCRAIQGNWDEYEEMKRRRLDARAIQWEVPSAS